MNILLVGSGAREHAIAQSLVRNKKVSLFSFLSTKNPGIMPLSKKFVVGNPQNVDSVIMFAKENSIELAIIGPESPLEAGLADALWKAGIPCVGPKKSAARIETDKSFARELMKKHRTGGLVEYHVFSNPDDAAAFIDSFAKPVVIKPLGLTGGKGVKVVDPALNGQLKNLNEAKAYAREVIEQSVGGQSKVLVEQKAVGEEFSLMAFVDGRSVVAMPLVQDHKFAFVGDTGPFTGGMGSISDSNHLLPFMSASDFEKAMQVMRNVVKAMDSEGLDYKGILYGGFMLTANGPVTMEFNARFGDPEAMNVLPILKTDLVKVCQSVTQGTLGKTSIEFESLATVCKYVVPQGYPSKPVKGRPITIGDAGKARIYYASVDQQASGLFLAGSRAIGCVGISDSIVSAGVIAEKAAQSISGPVFYRKDIGTRQLLQKRIDRMRALRLEYAGKLVEE